MQSGEVIWQVHPGVRFRRLLDEAVLICPHTAEALVLNDTAVSFIEACDGIRTVDQIIATLVADFTVSAPELAADLEPFIRQLAADGIIQRAAGADS